MPKFVKISFVILFILLVFVCCYKLFWLIYLNEDPPNIRSSLKSFTKAYYLSKLTGGYWEDEMMVQAEKIANLPQYDRVAFYRNIMLITCDLDTSRSIIFIEELGNDASALRADLISLKNSGKFNNLSKKQQRVVLDWIEELELVVEQQSWSKE